MDSSDNINVAAVEAELEAALNNSRYYAEIAADGEIAQAGRWAPIIEGMLGASTGAVGAGIAYATARNFTDAHDPAEQIHSWRHPGAGGADELEGTLGGDLFGKVQRNPPFINSGGLPNKRQKPMPAPDQGTKRASGTQITSHPKRKKGGKGGSYKRAEVGPTPKQAEKTPASKTIATAQSYYDSHLLLGTGEKRLTRLNVKLGKQLYPDCITPFLKNLVGRGVIRMQFAGRCISALNSRHNHLQVFRHRLSDNTGYNTGQTTTPAPFPTTFKNHILYPASTADFTPGGSTAGANHYAAGETPFRDIATNETYWAPYNLADLEDCSWNLNQLKFDSPLWDGSGNIRK